MPRRFSELGTINDQRRDWRRRWRFGAGARLHPRACETRRTERCARALLQVRLRGKARIGEARLAIGSCSCGNADDERQHHHEDAVGYDHTLHPR